MNETYTLLLKNKSKEIGYVDLEIKGLLCKNQTDINDFFEKFLFNFPKRLRPLFTFLVCDYLDLDIDDDILNLAVGVELLHSASLIHDDILDNGKLRRNMKCIHLEKGYKMAVLAGDYLLSLAMKAISKINSIKVLEIMANASYIMTRAEINALNLRYNTPDVDSYIELSKGKTSILFTSLLEAVFEIKQIKRDENLIKFAENFALCFQIKDDINNYQKQDKNKTSSDYDEGIYTLPLILNSCGIIDGAVEFLNNLIDNTEKLIDKDKSEELFKLIELFKIRIKK